MKSSFRLLIATSFVILGAAGCDNKTPPARVTMPTAVQTPAPTLPVKKTLSPPAPLQPAKQVPSSTLEQTIKQLEASGTIPVLDNGNDLKGPDVNGNGIRDDIDTYIAKQTYPEAERKAVEQLARGFQAILLLGDKSISEIAAKTVEKQTGEAINCLFGILKPDVQTADKIVHEYEKLTMNTVARMHVDGKYTDALDGAYLPGIEGNTCK